MNKKVVSQDPNYEQMATVWESELWHGHGLMVALLFLPEDCPLTEHIGRSYNKHYLGESNLLTPLSNKINDYRKELPEHALIKKKEYKKRIISSSKKGSPLAQYPSLSTFKQQRAVVNLTRPPSSNTVDLLSRNTQLRKVSITPNLLKKPPLRPPLTININLRKEKDA
jgi:hypothetical protein